MWELIIILTIILSASISIFNISSYRVKVKSYMITILIVFPVSIVAYHISEFLITIVSFVAMIILTYISTHKKGESLIIASLCVLNAFIADTIVSNIYIRLLKIDMNNYMQNISNMIIYWFLSIIIVILISICFQRFMSKMKEILESKIPGVQNFLIILLLVFSVAIFINNANLSKRSGLDNNLLLINGIILLSYFLIILVILFFLFHSVKVEQDWKFQQQELEHNRLELKELIIYTTELENMYEEMRSAKHDFTNILSTMSAFVAGGDIDGLMRYYSASLTPLVKELKQNNYKLGNLHNMKVTEVKGLLAIKVIEANQKNIDFVVELTDPIEKIPTDMISFCRIMGILVDNAIEEAGYCEEPYVRCAFVQLEDGLSFIINNSCRDGTPPINQMLQKGFSTKGKNHGLGLYNLNKMIEKDENVILDMENENNEFKVTITFVE